MITITLDQNNNIMRIGYNDSILHENSISVDSIPDKPELNDGELCELIYNNNQLEWLIYNVTTLTNLEPEHIEDEPIQEIETTNSDIDWLRSEQYRLRVDPITCEIQRLRDIAEDDNQIQVLIDKRQQIVDQIKQEYPYIE